jgi:hypothetical protein
MSDPVLRITFSDANGKPLAPDAAITIPAKLKKRTAIRVVRELSASILDENCPKAVEALGFK